MTPAKRPPKPKTVQCPACSGRGIVAVATEDVTCAACNGTGKVAA